MVAVKIDARKITEGITFDLHLEHVREFEIRIWIAVKLLVLAARIGGFGFESERK